MGLLPNSLGFKTVSSPGTAVQLIAVKTVARVMRLEPRRNGTTFNVGNIYVGGSNLNKNLPATIFAVLAPEQVTGVEILSGGVPFDLDISNCYVDSDNANDGVLVGYLV